MEVKINKTNGQKYVTIPKESPLKEGDEIEMNLKWKGLYGKENLKKYYKENRESLIKLKSELKLNYNKNLYSLL